MATAPGLHELDQDEHDWDPRVGDDATSLKFSMGISGRAFFVVGLHPHASRMARRPP
ncbi:YqcI/YcgG family protein [Roseateles agri]|uniref:YqcI/YcgG family protein n=1 Tax=Roseateles agri TaxID=3098619 RepID=UPI003D669892